MFVISQSQSYVWPVTVEIPTDGGRFEKQAFDVEFRRLPQSRVNELLNSDTVTNTDFCKEAVVGWKGVVDANGQEVPFSDGALKQLIEVPQIARFIANAFIESLAGGGARRKN